MSDITVTDLGKIFNGGHRIFYDFRIEVLNWGLGFSPTPVFKTEGDLKKEHWWFLKKIEVRVVLQE